MSITNPQLKQEEALAPDLFADKMEEATSDQRWYVMVHNDDVTPLESVIRILNNLFLLSEEIAEHVAQTAHSDGKAVVVVRPRAEAERLMKVGRAHARLDGYPLSFSLELES